MFLLLVLLHLLASSQFGCIDHINDLSFLGYDPINMGFCWLSCVFVIIFDLEFFAYWKVSSLRMNDVSGYELMQDNG